ncbi:MAG TPA: PEP-utilizing enzyme [Terriglobia bacterium]|jgi:pyruvate,water dikinase
MTREWQEASIEPGYWERRESRYPVPMSRHLWELVTPAFLQGTQRAFERYGCAVEYFDIARVRGRRYFRAQFVETPEKLAERRETAEKVWREKLWRRDCAEWPEVKDNLRRRLLTFARRDPQRMSLTDLQDNLAALRNLLAEGTIQHFIQQPASMVPVGDWVRRTHDLTGASISDIVAVLQSCRPSLADCLHMVDEIAENIRSLPGTAEFVCDESIHPDIRLEQLRRMSPEIRKNLDAYLHEYGDRIITGFDIVDATLRELPGCTLSLITSRLDRAAARQPHAEVFQAAAARLRGRLPVSEVPEFESGLAEARMAYGLHDEDVRTTYLWPLGLMRRSVLAAAGRLFSRGALKAQADVFQTTPAELDALLSGGPAPCAEEISARADQWRAWADEEPPPTFGEKPLRPGPEVLGEACSRISSAIMFYLAEMEGQETYPIQPASNLTLQGLAASPGSYEGRARIVRDPSDLAKVAVGDVLVAQTTSPAYNVILPAVGALVTARGGILSHAAIIAREFSVPAVVGINEVTARIPDGARVLVDGDNGLVAIRG